jgi:thioesterase domain-containing protein
MDQGHSELVPLRMPGRRPPLFCVHDRNFQYMAAAMQVDQSVYGLRPVNLDRASADLSVEQLAASHLQQICTIQEHGPYRLIGYSFGGLVAYEMATLLANRGEDVGFLALVDTLHPWFRRDLSPAESAQFRQTYLADRIRKYTRNLIHGRIQSIGSDTSRYIGTKIHPITWKITQRVCHALGRPLPIFGTSLMLEAMWRSYTPKEYRGSMVLFRVEKAMDGGSEFDSDPSLGWRKYAKMGVDVQFVQGGHGTVLNPPNVLNLVSKLVRYL